MRKIISKHDEEKKKKRNGMIVGGILIGVMILSILGYSFQSQDSDTETNTITYNGFQFVEQNSFWFVNVGDFQFSFKYNPKEVKETDSYFNKLNNYNGKVLYISSDYIEAQTEIYRNLFYQNQIILRMQAACLEGEECEENLPIKNCTDNFIIIEKSDFEGIVQEENCVFIQGSEENLTKLTDEFLFKITGIQ